MQVLKKTLANALSAEFPAFQFDYNVNGTAVKMSPEVKQFLASFKLKGWKPFEIFGNGTNLGEQVFYNPTLDLYFSLAANNEDDDEVFDTAVIFTMDGDHQHTLFTISHDRSQE